MEVPENNKPDIVREPIKGANQAAAASRLMRETLVKANEKARENTPAKEESPEEYASDKITDSAETVFYSGMHLAQEAARSRRKSATKKADRVEDTKAARPREPPRDQTTEAGRKAAAKSAKKAAEEKRAVESSTRVPEPEASVLPEPLAPTDPAAPSPLGEAASHQLEKAEAKGKISGYGKAEAHTKKSPEGPLSYEKKVLLSDGSTGQGARNIKNAARPPNEVIEQSSRAMQAGARATIQKTQKSAQAANKAAKDTARATSRAAAAAAKAARAAIAEAKALSSAIMIGGGTAVFMILLVVLLGVSMAIFGRKSSSSSYTPVSAEVEAYTPIITKYAKQYGIPEYVELIKAVMMQESGGQGSDPMQCSESGYNTRYPRTPGSISDPEYSIEVGVQTIADVLQMASVDSPIDLDRISLALQGYNYGSGYITWALSNYGGYTELNAVEYSDMMAESYGWPGYGDKAYVAHVLRYYPIGRAFMGDGNAAIVAVAQTQLGNEGGLKYCEWYGYPYRVEWCVIFVSWCADQCGYLDEGVLPKMEGVLPLVDWFRERDQWQYRDYEPNPGDLIFYDWENDGIADHVGIVERVENGLIYSVEGNVDDRCIENSHYTGTSSIYGFGMPQY